MTADEVIATMDLGSIIVYLESTQDESWLTERCRSKDGKQHCVMSHIFEYGGGDTPVADRKSCAGGVAYDFFEARYATTYMVYEVNDGRDPGYPQSTPRERCVAYLRDMQAGRQKTVPELLREMDEEFDRRRQDGQSDDGS